MLKVRLSKREAASIKGDDNENVRFADGPGPDRRGHYRLVGDNDGANDINGIGFHEIIPAARPRHRQCQCQFQLASPAGRHQ